MRNVWCCCAARTLSPALGCSVGPLLSLRTAAFGEQCAERQCAHGSQGWVRHIHTLESVVPMLMVIGRTFGVASEKPENGLENTMNGNFSSIGTRQGGTGVNSIYWAHVPWLYGWSDDTLLSYCFTFNLTLCLLSLALKEMLDL